MGSATFQPYLGCMKWNASHGNQQENSKTNLFVSNNNYGGVRFFVCVAFFLGGNCVLKDDTLIHSSKDRQRLHTEAMGTVYIKLGVLLRNFEKYGVEVS